jgi:hypothetical protein
MQRDSSSGKSVAMTAGSGRSALGAALKLGALGVLGFVAAFALSSCGGGSGSALGTRTGITRTLPTSSTRTTATRTAEATTTEAVTTVPTVTETGGVTVTETTPTETRIRTETAPAETVTVVQTETAVAQPPPPPPPPPTTTAGVNPAAAAAAGAAVAQKNAEQPSSTDWGWIAFGILAATVLVGGIVWWLRSRSAKKRGGDAPPAANLPT